MLKNQFTFQVPGNHLLASILTAKSQDCHQYHNSLTIPHKALCERLLPLTNAWENFFLRSIIALPALTIPQEEKLQKIAARHLRVWGEENQRLCSHCGKKARIIDQFSYFCPQCGNCLVYLVHEGGAR